MLSPEAMQAINHIRDNLRVEISSKKVGGTAYYDGSPGAEITVRLWLGDVVISDDTNTVLFD